MAAKPICQRLSASTLHLALLLAVALPLCWVLTRGLGDLGRLTYQSARWHYDDNARFDNTWPTWATDLALALLSAAQAVRLCCAAPHSELRERVVALLACYAASTAIGGFAHQRYSGEFRELNTPFFRTTWSVVVCLTAASGAVLGLIGNELMRLRAAVPSAGGLGACVVSPRGGGRAAASFGVVGLRAAAVQMGPPAPVPVLVRVSDAVWRAWTAVMVTLAVRGAFSHTRPACDIFFAGASQALPTFYLQLEIFAWRGRMDRAAWWLLNVGLFGNMPLIFIYPWLVQRSGLNLGAVNALLHGVLAFSWCLQGLGLTSACLVAAGTRPSGSRRRSKQRLVSPRGDDACAGA